MQLMSIKIGLLSVLLLKTCVRKKGGLGGFAPQTLTRSYYFEPPLSKKRSRATEDRLFCIDSVIMIRHLNPRSENILPSHDAQLELQSVHEATQFRNAVSATQSVQEQRSQCKSFPSFRFNSLGSDSNLNLLLSMMTKQWIQFR